MIRSLDSLKTFENLKNEITFYFIKRGPTRLILICKNSCVYKHKKNSSKISKENLKIFICKKNALWFCHRFTDIHSYEMCLLLSHFPNNKQQFSLKLDQKSQSPHNF